MYIVLRKDEEGYWQPVMCIFPNPNKEGRMVSEIQFFEDFEDAVEFCKETFFDDSFEIYNLNAHGTINPADGLDSLISIEDGDQLEMYK